MVALAECVGTLCPAFSFVTVGPWGPGRGSELRGLLSRIRTCRSQHGRVDWANSTNAVQNTQQLLCVTTHHVTWREREDPGSPNSSPLMLMAEPPVLLELSDHSSSHSPGSDHVTSSAVTAEFRGFIFDNRDGLRYINKVMGPDLPQQWGRGTDKSFYNDFIASPVCQILCCGLCAPGLGVMRETDEQQLQCREVVAVEAR